MQKNYQIFKSNRAFVDWWMVFGESIFARVIEKGNVIRHWSFVHG